MPPVFPGSRSMPFPKGRDRRDHRATGCKRQGLTAVSCRCRSPRASDRPHPRQSVRRGQIGPDSKPRFQGGTLVFEPHRFVPFKTTPDRVLRRVTVRYMGQLASKLLELLSMTVCNLPEPASSLEYEPEDDADDRHGDHQLTHGEAGAMHIWSVKDLSRLQALRTYYPDRASCCQIQSDWPLRRIWTSRRLSPFLIRWVSAFLSPRRQADAPCVHIWMMNSDLHIQRVSAFLIAKVGLAMRVSIDCFVTLRSERGSVLTADDSRITGIRPRPNMIQRAS